MTDHTSPAPELHEDPKWTREVWEYIVEPQARLDQDYWAWVREQKGIEAAERNQIDGMMSSRRNPELAKEMLSVVANARLVRHNSISEAVRAVRHEISVLEATGDPQGEVPRVQELLRLMEALPDPSAGRGVSR